MAETSTQRWVVGAVIAFAVLLFAGPLLFGMSGGMMGWGGMSSGMWGSMHDGAMASETVSTGWWVFAAIWRLLILAVFVGGGYLVYRAVADGGGRDPAIDELRSAYARGDLDDEEFERRRERLEE